VGRTAKERALGRALRNVRKECGMSLSEIAAKIGRHSGEISRWETGERPLTPDRVGQILNAIGVNGRRYDQIVSLAYESKEDTTWIATTLPERQQQLTALIDFERSAKLIIDVSPLLFPGLLQAASYIRAIMTAADVPKNEIASRVAVRVGRREAITDRNAAQYICLLGETVLHQMVGGPETMLEQYRHLLDMAGRSNVDLRIVPFRSGWNPALEGAFTIIESEESIPVVQVENRRSTFLIHEDDDVKAYRRAVTKMSQAALTPDDSAKTISAAIDRLENRT
jgi:transcriptional regulator with XRE-family HTH domain